MSAKPKLLVVGAGVCGLTTAIMAARMGFEVEVVESRRSLGGGATSRTEGWLHAGTFHTSRTTNAQEAVQVARECMEGSSWIKSYCPEAISSLAPPMIALIRGEELAKNAVERWAWAGIFATEIGPRQLRADAPEITMRDISRAFVVADLVLNVPLLLRRLALDCQRMGVTLTTDRHVEVVAHSGVLSITCQSRRITADAVILCTGYETASLLAKAFPESSRKARIWRSHLLWWSSPFERSMVCLDPGEASLLVHRGGLCVLGINDDDVEVEVISDEPSSVSWQDAARAAATRLVAGIEITDVTEVTCHKIDWDRPGNSQRSVRPTVTQLAPAHYLCLPGKLTTSPVAAAAAVSAVCGTFDHANAGDGIEI